MRRFLLLILMAVCLASPVFAQVASTFTFTPLPTWRLLSSANVRRVFQDSEGYMWYGTESAGVCRDNGYQVDVFYPSEISGVPESNHIMCIAERNDGALLFGTERGLFCLDKHDYQLRGIPPEDEKIEALLTDSNGETWIGTNGMVRALSTGQVLTLRTVAPKPIASLYEDSHGALYALEWQGGLLRKDKGDESFTPLEWPADIHPVQMVEDTSLHCFWVVTRTHGVVKLTINGTNCLTVVQPVTQRDADMTRSISAMRDMSHGLLWVTTVDNLYAYTVRQDGQLEPYPLPLMPSGKKVLDQLCQVRTGEIYVASFMPQTFIVHPEYQHISRFTLDAMRHQSGFPIQAKRCMHEAGHFWFWHTRAYLCCYDIASDHLIQAPWKVDSWFQRASSRGRGIWASRNKHLYHVTENGGQLRREEVCAMPLSAVIRSICDTGHDVLYIATDDHLYRFSLVGNNLQELAPLTTAPSDMVATPTDLFWLTQGKLFHLPLPNSIATSSEAQPDRPYDIQCATALAAGSEGDIWLATQGGDVYRCHPAERSIERIDYMSDGSQVPICDIAVDGTGHVWTVNEQQVREYNPQNQACMTWWANSEEMNVAHFAGIDFEDATHACINGAGAMFLTETSSALNQPPSAVRPSLTAYSVDGVKHFATPGLKEITLRHGNADLTIYVSTFEQPVANRISFAYKLEGLNHNWVRVPMGENTIHFNKMPAGNYRLRVMASDRNGCWGEAVDMVAIRSLPAWYASWWAYLIYIILVFAVAYAVWQIEHRIRLLHRLIRRRQEVKLTEIELKREDVTQTRIDDEFLHKAVQTVEEHLADADFNVEALADAMCMSRANLHRRMKAQTGQSPTDFIRDIRLKKAAQIFASQPEATITDVAARVGFATPKYLAKCFKEKFGVAPKDYGREGTDVAK